MAIEFLLSMYYVTDFTRLVRNEIRFLIVPSWVLVFNYNAMYAVCQNTKSQ